MIVQRSHPENLARIEALASDLELYIDDARRGENHSERTLRTVRVGFRNFARYLESRAHLPHEDFLIVLHDLREWTKWNRDRGLRPISVNAHWRSLRAFFRFRARSMNHPNPYEGAKAPGFQAPPPKALERPDVERLFRAARNLSWASDYERALVLALIGTMAYAGVRLGELLRLEQKDVHLRSGKIAIIEGKGRDGGRERPAFINAALAQVLSAYERQRHLRHFDAPEYFVNERTKRGIGEITIRRYVRRLAQAAQVKWSPHMLRHSFVTHLLEGGTPIHIVRDLAGHRNVATTLNYYATVFDDNRKTAIDSLRY
jgi:site-specific recombinase XerD